MSVGQGVLDAQGGPRGGLGFIKAMIKHVEPCKMEMKAAAFRILAHRARRQLDGFDDPPVLFESLAKEIEVAGRDLLHGELADLLIEQRLYQPIYSAPDLVAARGVIFRRPA